MSHACCAHGWMTFGAEAPEGWAIIHHGIMIVMIVHKISIIMVVMMISISTILQVVKMPQGLLSVVCCLRRRFK